MEGLGPHRLAMVFPFHDEKEEPMHSGRFIFSQLMVFLPRYEYHKCIQRHRGNHRVRSFSCYDQFVCMLPPAPPLPARLGVAKD